LKKGKKPIGIIFFRSGKRMAPRYLDIARDSHPLGGSGANAASAHPGKRT